MTQVWNGDVDTGTLVASYYYDPFGRRLWKEVSGVRTYFHYADEGLIGEYDATGAEIKTYGWKPSSTWGTDPLFMKEGSSYYFYHTDHLGTPQKMTAVNGAVVWSAKYSSFGKCTVDVNSTITNSLRYPGQFFDEDTGLYYNYYRYYDSGLGRYLKDDPIGFSGGINLYIYSLNNPANFIDNFGLNSEDYRGIPKPDVFDVIGLINTTVTVMNSFKLMEQLKIEMLELAYTVKCGEKVLAYACWEKGPPPRDLKVGKGRMLLAANSSTACMYGNLTGRKNCPCINKKDDDQFIEETWDTIERNLNNNEVQRMLNRMDNDLISNTAP